MDTLLVSLLPSSFLSLYDDEHIYKIAGSVMVKGRDMNVGKESGTRNVGVWEGRKAGRWRR